MIRGHVPQQRAVAEGWPPLPEDLDQGVNGGSVEAQAMPEGGDELRGWFGLVNGDWDRR
jgi:hypothetical protein